MDIGDELVEIERQLWRNDAALYRQHLAPEAQLVFAETGIIGRETAILAIQAEVSEGRVWDDVRFDDMRLLEVSDGVAALIYRATARWLDDENPIIVLCSSLYTSRNGAWKLLLHQQSAVEDVT